MSERREPERYADVLLLLDGAAAARGVLEGMLEDGPGAADASEIEDALEPLRTMGRVAPGGAVAGGHGRPLEPLAPDEARASLQEFRAGTVVVDYSGEERDDLDRVIGAQVAIELEDPNEPGYELIRFEDSEELVAYHAEWGIATVPGSDGVLARLDLEFEKPQRFSMRLLFDVTSHQWALSAMELTGRCLVTVKVGEEKERRVRVRAPRSAQLTSALAVVRMLDPMPISYEEAPLTAPPRMPAAD